MTGKQWGLAGTGVLAAAGLALLLSWRLGYLDTYDYQAAFEQPSQAQGAMPLALVGFAGKDKNAVAKLLGEPIGCERGEFSERCRYPQQRIQITYINGRADWITVPLSGRELILQAQTLAVLGLPVREPDEQTEHEAIWHKLGGYREVRLVGGDEGVLYACIKYATP